MARPKKDAPPVSQVSPAEPAKRRGRARTASTDKIKWTKIPADLPVEEVVRIAQGGSVANPEISEKRKIREKNKIISKVSNGDKTSPVRKPAKVKTPPDTQIDGIADGIAPAPKHPRKKPATGPSGAPATAQPIAEPAPKKKRGAPVGNQNAKGNRGVPGNQFAKGCATSGRPAAFPVTQEMVDTIKKLSSFGCTQREAAAWLEMPEDNFENILRNSSRARVAWERGGSKFNVSLRRKNAEVAMSGNVQMLKFLSMNRLGMVDKMEHGGDPDRPIKSEMAFKVEFVKSSFGSDQYSTPGSL